MDNPSLKLEKDKEALIVLKRATEDVNKRKECETEIRKLQRALSKLRKQGDVEITRKTGRKIGETLPSKRGSNHSVPVVIKQKEERKKSREKVKVKAGNQSLGNDKLSAQYEFITESLKMLNGVSVDTNKKVEALRMATMKEIESQKNKNAQNPDIQRLKSAVPKLREAERKEKVDEKQLMKDKAVVEIDKVDKALLQKIIADGANNLITGEGDCVKMAFEAFAPQYNFFEARGYALWEIISVLSSNDFALFIDIGGKKHKLSRGKNCVLMNVDWETTHCLSFLQCDDFGEIIGTDYCVTKLFKRLLIEISNQVYQPQDLEALASKLNSSIIVSNGGRIKVYGRGIANNKKFLLGVNERLDHAVSIAVTTALYGDDTLSDSRLALASKSLLDDYQKSLADNSTDLRSLLKDSAEMELIKATNLYMQCADPFHYMDVEARVPDGDAGLVAVVPQAAIHDIQPLVGQYGVYVGAISTGGILDLGYVLSPPTSNTYVISSFGGLSNTGRNAQIKTPGDWTSISEVSFSGAGTLSRGPGDQPLMIPIGTGFSTGNKSPSFLTWSDLYANGAPLNNIGNASGYQTYTLYNNSNAIPAGMACGVGTSVYVSYNFDYSFVLPTIAVSFVAEFVLFYVVDGNIFGIAQAVDNDSVGDVYDRNPVDPLPRTPVQISANTITYGTRITPETNGRPFAIIGFGVNMYCDDAQISGSPFNIKKLELSVLMSPDGDYPFEQAPFSNWSGFGCPDEQQILDFANQFRTTSKSLLFSDGTADLIAGGFVSAVQVESGEYPGESGLTGPRTLAQQAGGLNHRMPLGVYSAPYCMPNVRSRCLRDVEGVFDPAQPYTMVMSVLPKPTSGQYIFRGVFSSILELTSKNTRFIKQVREDRDDLVMQALHNVFTHHPILTTNEFHFSDILDGLKSVGRVIVQSLPAAVDAAQLINNATLNHPGAARLLGVLRPMSEKIADLAGEQKERNVTAQVDDNIGQRRGPIRVTNNRRLRRK